MKKTISSIILNIVILLLLVAGCVFGIFFLYDYSDFFRSLFAGSPAALPLDNGSDLPVEGLITMSKQFCNQLSLYLFSAIVAVQVGALYTAIIVVGLIKKNGDDPAMKMKKLENADIFLDLPLYVGLFGTVASFIVMSFNPQTSRLIAYSSTLIGIVISVILRTTVLFPYRQKLLSAKKENN